MSEDRESPLVAMLPFSVSGYTFVSVLGQGAFSTVFKVLHEGSQMFFAAKAMRLDMPTKMDVIGAEIDSLKTLYHPNIIKIYEVIKSNDHIFIIIELCNGMNVKELIRDSNSIPMDQLVCYFKQILLAISYCHERKVAHRDIKPANIFVEPSGRCVLGDFGLSCKSIVTTTQFCGSLAFKPPEILLKKAYNPLMADIWSLGVTFYTMAVGSTPWKPSPVMPTERCIILCDYYMPPTLHKDIISLIKSMITIDPMRRKTANELLQNSLFEGVGKLVPMKYAKMNSIPLCVRSSSVQKRICKPRIFSNSSFSKANSIGLPKRK